MSNPHLTCVITNPGDSAMDVALFMAWAGASMQSTISSNFGRQGDTASIILVDDYSASVPGFAVTPNTPHFKVKPLATIVLTDQGAVSQPAQGVIFSGLVTNPQWRWSAPGRVEWMLQCVDFTYYADTAIVQGLYAGLTADEILIDLVAQANCGLNAKSVKNGGYVYPGPTIPVAKFDYETLSSAFTTLTGLASQSQVYGIFVDPERNVWFYPTSKSLPSGVTVTDTPTSSIPSISECHVDSSLAYPLTYEWDATTFYTRSVVEGATITHSYSTSKAKKGEIPPTDSWVGNGVQSSWPLSYQPEVSSTALKTAAGIVSTAGGTVNSGIYLTVGGVARDVTVNDGTTNVTTPFQFIQATNGLWTLQVTAGIGSTPPGGAAIKLWYKYQLPILAIANNRSQQVNAGGPNHGVFADLTVDTSILTSASALARAKSVLNEYGAPQERLTFYTDESFLGWFRCGQTVAVDISQLPDSAHGYALGLTGTFFVNQLMVIFQPGGYRKTEVTSVRVA